MKPLDTFKALTPDALAALEQSGVSRRSFLKRSGILVVGFSTGLLTSRLAAIVRELAELRAAEATRFVWLQEIWDRRAEQKATEEWLAVQPARTATTRGIAKRR